MIAGGGLWRGTDKSPCISSHNMLNVAADRTTIDCTATRDMRSQCGYRVLACASIGKVDLDCGESNAQAQAYAPVA
jgi:hypothetical protein